MSGKDSKHNPDMRELYEQLEKLKLELIQKEETIKKLKNTSKTIIKPEKPDLFHGATREVDSWIFQVSNYKKLARLEDDQAINFAVQFLRGDALVWWRSRQREAEIIRNETLGIPMVDGHQTISTWKNFTDSARKEFRRLNAEDIARDRLPRLR